MIASLCTCPDRPDPDWNGKHEEDCPYLKTKSIFDRDLCERLIREAREDGALRDYAEQLEAALAEISSDRTEEDRLRKLGLDINDLWYDTSRSMKKLSAEVEEARSILGAGFSEETLKQAAERVEAACAARARERDMAKTEVERLSAVIREARSNVLSWNGTTPITMARVNLAIMLDDALYPDANPIEK